MTMSRLIRHNFKSDINCIQMNSVVDVARTGSSATKTT